MNNNELLQNALELQKNKIISNSEYWISFIQTMSRHYKYNLAEKAFRFLQMITKPHVYMIYPRPVLYPASLQKCPGYGTCMTAPLK